MIDRVMFRLAVVFTAFASVPVLAALPLSVLGVLGDVLRIGCLLAAGTFVFRYIRVGWDKTDEGRHLMGFTFIVAVFMALVVYTRFFGRFAGLEAVGVELFGILLWLLVQRNLLLTRAQREYAASVETEESEHAND